MTSRYKIATLKDRDLENLTNVTQMYKARFTYWAGNKGPLTEM